jgi:SAM-dependent methyltransferase
VADLERFQHRRFALAYQRVSLESEARGVAAHRDRLLSGLAGRVIEIGAGNGLNFAHYPRTVTEVVAVEPEDTLRGLAERSAAAAPVPVRVVAGHIGSLPAADGTFDAAVASLVLCSVPDLARGLAEIRRVLRPGGELRFYEHVRSAGALRGVAEDLATPLWRRLAAGCHPNRRTDQAISAAGFAIEQMERFRFRPLRLSPASDHILGRARLRPATGAAPAG